MATATGMAIIMELPVWTCVLCRQIWPAYTTTDSYQMRAKAAEVHPGIPCQKDPYVFEMKNRISCLNCSGVLWQIVTTLGREGMIIEIMVQCARCGYRMIVDGTVTNLREAPQANTPEP